MNTLCLLRKMGSKAFLSMAIVLLISSEVAASYLPETLSDQKNVEATKEANYGGSGGNLGNGLRNTIIHDLSQRISILTKEYPGDGYGRYPEGRVLKDLSSTGPGGGERCKKCCKWMPSPEGMAYKICCPNADADIKAKPQN